jgi:hypothetical protein
LNLELFKTMAAPELRTYIEFLLWHYRVMDSFWYLNVAEQFDEPTADRLNEKVWGRITAMAAKSLVKRFAIEERGLKGFVRALRYWPWCILVDYHIDESAEEVMISVPSCLWQQDSVNLHGVSLHWRRWHLRPVPLFFRGRYFGEALKAQCSCCPYCMF